MSNNPHDSAYYAARALEERRLAMASSNPLVRRIHLEMAATYAIQAGPDATLGELNPAPLQQESVKRRA